MQPNILAAELRKIADGVERSANPSLMQAHINLRRVCASLRVVPRRRIASTHSVIHVKLDS